MSEFTVSKYEVQEVAQAATRGESYNLHCAKPQEVVSRAKVSYGVALCYERIGKRGFLYRFKKSTL